MIMMTRMPAVWQARIASGTSSRIGSVMAARPKKTNLVSISSAE